MHGAPSKRLADGGAPGTRRTVGAAAPGWLIEAGAQDP